VVAGLEQQAWDEGRLMDYLLEANLVWRDASPGSHTRWDALGGRAGRTEKTER
jgi:hypothetical protein